MPGFNAIIRKLHHILRATPVTLFHVVGVNTEGPVTVNRTPQHLCPRTTVHRLQITGVHLAIEIVTHILEVVGLQVVHVDIVLHILTHAGAHTRQFRVSRRIGVVKFVVVVGNVGEQAAGCQQVIAQPPVGGRHRPKLVHVETFRPPNRLV